MKISQKYKEIFRLKKMLEDAKIPFDFYSLQDDIEPRIKKLVPDFEHWHINYPHQGDFIISAIEGVGSYGESDDKIEIMVGGLTEEKQKSEKQITGWLTAEEVFDIIKKDYMRRNKIEKGS